MLSLISLKPLSLNLEFTRQYLIQKLFVLDHILFFQKNGKIGSLRILHNPWVFGLDFSKKIPINKLLFILKP